MFTFAYKYNFKFSSFNAKTAYRDHIRACSEKDLILTQPDYWNVISDENTASKITDERFGKTELITNRINNEPNE